MHIVNDTPPLMEEMSFPEWLRLPKTGQTVEQLTSYLTQNRAKNIKALEIKKFILVKFERGYEHYVLAVAKKSQMELF